MENRVLKHQSCKNNCQNVRFKKSSKHLPSRSVSLVSEANETSDANEKQERSK